MDGLSLRGLLDGDTEPHHSHVYASKEAWRSVRAEDWKLVRDGASPVGVDAGRVDSLYRIDEDPAELTDLSHLHPDKLAEMRAFLRRMEDSATCESVAPAALTEEQEVRLRELGYLE